MKIYAISDLHGNLPDIPQDADLLILGGDICPDFRPTRREHWEYVDKHGSQQAHWLKWDFREWLDTAPDGCRVVAIWGNHDFVGETDLVPDLPWTLLNESETTVDGIRIWGTSGVPGLPYWAFHSTDSELSSYASCIPEEVDIIVSHGPPYGAGDFIPTSRKQQEKYGNFDGQRVGNLHLSEAIRQKRPGLVICGHIHEDRGVHHVANARHVDVYNVAAVDGHYKLHRNPWVEIPV